MDIHKQHIIEKKGIDEIERHLRNYVESFNSEIFALEKSLEETRTQLVEARNQNSNLEKENFNISEKNKETNKQSLILENRLSYEMSVLKSETEQKNIKLSELSQELLSLRSQYQQAVDERRIRDQQDLALAEESVRLEVESQKSKIFEERRIQQIIEEKDVEIEKVKQNIAELNILLSKAENEMNSRQERILDLENQIVTLTLNILTLRESFDEAIARESILKERQLREIRFLEEKNSKELLNSRNETESLQVLLNSEKENSSLKDAKTAELSRQLSFERERLAQAMAQATESVNINQLEVKEIKRLCEIEISTLKLSFKEKEERHEEKHRAELNDHLQKCQFLVDESEQKVFDIEIQLNRQKAMHTETLAALAIKADAEKHELIQNGRRELDQMMNGYEKKISILEKNLKEQERIFQNDMMEQKERQKTLISEQFAEQQHLVDSAKLKIMEKEAEFDRQRAIHSEELNELKQRFENDKLELIQAGRREFDQMKANYEKDLSVLEQNLREQVHIFRSDMEEQKELHKTLVNEQLAEQQRLVDDAREKVAKKEIELDRQKGIHVSEQAQLFIKFDAETARLEQKIQNMTQQLNRTIQEKKNESERLAEREKQLNHYYHFVCQEKAKDQKMLQSLARQINFAITLHPLQDYLAVTEKELSRVECELKKTPSISPYRAQYETLIDQLVQQRDFMRSLISKTEKKLLQHTETLDRLARGTLGTAAPPPPPAPEMGLEA